jgi:hypothetical protein
MIGAMVTGAGVMFPDDGGTTGAAGGASGRFFLAPPRPSHDVSSSQPERFFGSAGVGAGTDAGTDEVAAGFGGSGRAGRVGGATGVAAAPSSCANVSQLAGFFSCSVMYVRSQKWGCATSTRRQSWTNRKPGLYGHSPKL